MPLPTQSKNYSNALKVGLPQIKRQWGGKEALGGKHERLWITAYFFCGKGSVPDLDGAFVGAGDLLQKAGVVGNDRWISSWDGSALLEWPEHESEVQTIVIIRPDTQRERRIIDARNAASGVYIA